MQFTKLHVGCGILSSVTCASDVACGFQVRDKNRAAPSDPGAISCPYQHMVSSAKRSNQIVEVEEIMRETIMQHCRGVDV